MDASYLLLSWILFGALAASISAKPIPVDALPENHDASWHLPGSIRGAELSPDQPQLNWKIPVPELALKDEQAGGEWRGIVTVDLHGVAAASGLEPGVLEISVLDPEGKVLASSGPQSAPATAAPRASETILASSEQPGGAARLAFDGQADTSWHSRYGGDQPPKSPHWIGLAFGQPKPLAGVRYQPRTNGYSNGVARHWRLEAQHPGSHEWVVLARGESEKQATAGKREPLEIPLDSPVLIDAFRFVIEKDWSGGGFGTAGELTPLGIDLLGEQQAVAAKRRLWIEIPPQAMAESINSHLVVRVSGSGDGRLSQIIETPRLARVHLAPSKKLFGRSNGGLGPDKLGAGLLGFDALTEHQQDVLPVLGVREETPAARAGLQRGDVIAAIDGRPLPRNDLAPGRGWLERSHEAFLGRAGERALAESQDQLQLVVLRQGNLQALTLRLPRSEPLNRLDPATDPVAEALLDDLVGHLERAQRDDGSWGGNLIRTTFASLALLATEDENQLDRVGRAVDWSLKKYPEPAAYGNLGFWFSGYASILYSEWYLRTGDEKVLQPLRAARDWAIAGQHESIWKVPALGHGPGGLPYGNKSLVAPACHLLVGEALAQRCGVESEIWELLLPYMKLAWSDPAEGGHGSLGYSKAAKDKQQFWSRTGLFAMAAHLRSEEPEMVSAMAGFMKERHAYLRNSHAYGEPGGALGLLGLHLVDPVAFDEVLNEYRWWFSLAWEPGYGLRYTTPHMGAPYMGEDELVTAAYALVLQARKKSLHLTGKSE